MTLKERREQLEKEVKHWQVMYDCAIDRAVRIMDRTDDEDGNSGEVASAMYHLGKASVYKHKLNDAKLDLLNFDKKLNEGEENEH